MSFATGTTQCNTSTVGIRITEGAVWVDSLANLNSDEFSGLANNLTVAVSNNNKQIFVQLSIIAIKVIGAGSDITEKARHVTVKFGAILWVVC